MAQAGTVDRILDTAEVLFAQKGFAETSLRAITSKAGVNLAAVNYHFGSKESLVQAVFERFLTPFCAALDAKLEFAGDRGLPLCIHALSRQHHDGDLGALKRSPREYIQQCVIKRHNQRPRCFLMTMPDGAGFSIMRAGKLNCGYRRLDTANEKWQQALGNIRLSHIHVEVVATDILQ